MTDQQETDQTPQEPQENSSGASGPDIETPDFGAEAESLGLPDYDQPSADMMTKDAFFGMFCGLWTAPNMGLLMAGKKPLTSLNVSPSDPGAREASDALYHTIADIPAMQWLLNPASEWVQRLMVIGAFVAPRLMGAVSEWKAQVDDGPAMPDQPEHSNDDLPPVPSGPVMNVEPVD